MGYAINVAMSVPMAIIIYLLVEKMIVELTSNNKFNERVQNGFIMSFIVGLIFITLGMTLFGKKSDIENQSVRLALYAAGSMLILNSTFFSWGDLDEGTKIIILIISALGLIFFSYSSNMFKYK